MTREEFVRARNADRSYTEAVKKLEEFENKLGYPVTVKLDCRRAGGSTATIVADFTEPDEAAALIGLMKQIWETHRDKQASILNDLGVILPGETEPTLRRTPIDGRVET